MDGIVCQNLLNDHIHRSVRSSTHVDVHVPDSTLSFLPIWKQELILRKRLSSGAGTCNVNSGWKGARGNTPAIILGLENQTQERLRIHSKGLVASLQAVYEPLVEARGELPRARLASPSSSAIGLGMLARPWQAGALHGSEPASSPPPLSKSPPQLGAGSIHSSTEAFSPSQSRSVSGCSPTRCADTSASHSVRGAKSGSHVTEPAPLNHYQALSVIPTRRLSEPKRTRTSTAMVEETRSRSSVAAQVDSVDNRVQVGTKGTFAWKTMAGNRDNEDEELQYGPGIVNKLKSRYLSRTLRERPLSDSRRPSLRRAASLEDWLDKDSVSQHSPLVAPADSGFPVLVRTSATKTKSERPVSLNLAAQISESKPPSSSSTTKVRDLKKTRSVDCVTQPTWRSVSVSDLDISPSTTKPSVSQTAGRPTTPASPKTPIHLLLSKDSIVIVEKNDAQVGKNETRTGSLAAPSATSPTTPIGLTKPRRTLHTNTRYNVEEGELPAPDTVRQVKRLFETGTSRKVPSSRRSQSAGPGVNRIPLSASNQTATDKSVQRMNQFNVANNKPGTAVVRKKSDNTPRITELSVETKPVVITKPSPVGPKPTILSPKPTIVIDKTRVVQSAPNGAMQPQRKATPPKLTTVPIISPTNISSIRKECSDDKDEDVDKRTNGHRFISKTALENIRKESTSVKFSFDEKKDDSFSSAVQSKQIGVIRPQLKTPVFQSDKTVFMEDSTPKENIITEPIVLRKEEVVTVPQLTSTSLSKAQQQTELVQLQTTKPVSPFVPTSPAPASQTTPGRTKQPQAGAAPIIAKVELGSVTDGHFSDPVGIGQIASPIPSSIKSATETINLVPLVKSTTPSSKSTGQQTTATTTTSVHSPASGASREQKKPWPPYQSENTTVFNFVNDTSRSTDHIRKEGGSSAIHVYKSNDSGITKLPDYDPGESSDFIDDLDILKRPPSPCNVDFEGANIIVGKSLILRRTRKNKLKITFNDEMTRLFEYPSESSLLEERDVERLDDHDQRDSSSNTKGGFSNYTPSKVHIETSFELGVSRPILIEASQPNLPSSTVSASSDVHYLTPAEETTTWSAETTSDLLF